MKKAAVIDIGSNSIRYMEECGSKQLLTTRLAEGLVNTGKLSEAAIIRSLHAIGTFAAQAQSRGLQIYAYATSAVRDAANSSDFCEAVKRQYGIDVEILSGSLEAELALLGSGCEALMDIGGGSTQLICRDFVKSYPIGAVRAKDFLQNGIPLRRVLDEIFDELPEPGAEFAGAGGTITTLAALDMGLARYEACLVQGHRLTFNRLRQLTAELDAMGEAGRRALPMLLNRYDIIIYGAMILEYLMNRMRLSHITVSDADGMEGYLIYKRRGG